MKNPPFVKQTHMGGEGYLLLNIWLVSFLLDFQGDRVDVDEGLAREGVPLKRRRY